MLLLFISACPLELEDLHSVCYDAIQGPQKINQFLRVSPHKLHHTKDSPLRRPIATNVLSCNRESAPSLCDVIR